MEHRVDDALHSPGREGEGSLEEEGDGGERSVSEVVVRQKEAGGGREGDGDDDDEVYFDASFFVDESYELQDFEWGPHRLQLWALRSSSTDYDLTGQIVWPGTELVCDYLLSREGGGGEGVGEGREWVSGLLEGKAVVELGSGIGVTGLLCGRLGATSVLLTDHNDTVLKVLQRNVDEEATAGVSSSSTSSSPPPKPFLECAKLEWGRNSDVDKIRETHPHGFDVIIGADICYQGGSIPSLFATVRRLMDIRRLSLLSASAPDLDLDRAKRELDLDPDVETVGGVGLDLGPDIGTVVGGLRKGDLREEEEEGSRRETVSYDEGGVWREPVFVLGYVSRWKSLDTTVVREARKHDFLMTEVVRRKVCKGGYDASVYKLTQMFPGGGGGGLACCDVGA